MTDAALQFRDPEAARELAARIDDVVGEIDGQVNLMHVCGSHE
ncbi:hypothetical protein [Natrarchaeobaculum sulfurireducens]|nr:hypothetical protein [Natrarchaeobaculum sulfurireducens]